MSLYQEILQKCPELIAAGNFHAIAAAVSVGRTKTVVTPIESVQAWLQTNGLWWAIKAASKDVAHPAQAAAEAVMDVANARYQNLDMSLPIIGQMFAGLVATGVITQAESDVLTSMGTVADPVTWQACNEAVDAGV